MVRSKRYERRVKRGLNWVLIMLTLLFVFTFHPNIFDTNINFFLNDFLFEKQQMPVSTPIVEDVDAELKKIEDLLDKGELLIAKDKINRLLSQGISGGKIHFLLGLFYKKMSQEYQEKTISEFRISALYNETQALSCYELGKVYFSKGDYKEALDAFLKVRQKFSDDPIFLKYLGITYFKLGKYEKSKEFLSSALKIARKDEEVIAYLEKISNMVEAKKATPVPSAIKTEISWTSSSGKPLLSSKNLDTYLEKVKDFDGDLYVIYENITYKVLPKGGFKEDIYRIIYIKNPVLLKDGIKFKYNKRIISFSLYTLYGIKESKEEIPADKFDYYIKSIGDNNEEVVISFNTREPIFLVYNVELTGKSIIKDKFQFSLRHPIYPFDDININFLISQGIGFNVYPKKNMKVEIVDNYKKISFKFKNISYNSFPLIVINNFTTYKDVYNYLEVLLANYGQENPNISDKDDEETIYNKIIDQYFDNFKDNGLYLFKDHIYGDTFLGDNLKSNIFLVKILSDLYREKGLLDDIGILLEKPSNIGFPYIFSANWIIRLKQKGLLLEPYPYVAFGSVLPDDIGKKVYFINSLEETYLTEKDYYKNLKEDYVKININNLENIGIISYNKGLFDTYYRQKFYYKEDFIKSPNCWLFNKNLSLLYIDSSNIRKLNIPFQASIKADARALLKDGKLYVPYIYLPKSILFPFTVKRRVDINLEDYNLKDIPPSISIQKEGVLYTVKYSFKKETNRLTIENTYVLQDIKNALKFEDLKRMEKLYLKIFK